METVSCCLKKITHDTGVVFSLLMSALMVKTFVAYFLSKGLRADTYLSAVRAAHTMRGLEAPAFSEMSISAALNRTKNKESLKDEESREAVSVQDMKDIKHKIS